MLMRHHVPMSIWYDQLVGYAAPAESWASHPKFSRPFFLPPPTTTGRVSSLMAVSRVTSRLCAQDCWTALISAAKEGHIEVVRELLENNVNLEHRDMVGKCGATGMGKFLEENAKFCRTLTAETSSWGKRVKVLVFIINLCSGSFYDGTCIFLHLL